jgi:hypothetical protein
VLVALEYDDDGIPTEYRVGVIVRVSGDGEAYSMKDKNGAEFMAPKSALRVA